MKKYNRSLRVIPTNVSAINKLNASKLRELLHYHKLPIHGTKEKFVMRVYLLRHGEKDAIIARKQEQVLDLIRVCKLLMIAQKKLASCVQNKNISHRQRKVQSFYLHTSHLIELYDPKGHENCK